MIVINIQKRSILSIKFFNYGVFISMNKVELRSKLQ